MKHFVIMLTLVGMFTFSKAQDKLFVNMLLNYPANLPKAKAEIDKIMADPKNQGKVEGWLWKSRVYAEIYFTESLQSTYPDAGNIAFESFKKYESLEPSYKQLGEVASWRPLDLIYVTGFNQGRKFFDDASKFNNPIKEKSDLMNRTKIRLENKTTDSMNLKEVYYNANKSKDSLTEIQSKLWDSSYHYFVAAAYMGDIIAQKDLRKTGAKLDTMSVVYAGYAAQNAKKEVEATKYYAKLIDIRANGDEYKDVYTYTLVHYANIKDAENFNKYLAISKEVYPKGEWDDYEFDFLNKAYNMQQKEEQYDKQDATGTLSARKYLLFGQMFSEIMKEEKAILDSSKKAYYEKKSASAYIKAFEKDNTLGLAAFNAGVIYYNEYSILDDRYRANIKILQDLNSNRIVEKDPKKRLAADTKYKADVDAVKKINQEVDKQMSEAVDMSINWLEKSFNSLNAQETKDRTTHNCLNKSVDWLANLYQYKSQKVKGKDMKAYDVFDAKYKQYDALHSKM